MGGSKFGAAHFFKALQTSSLLNFQINWWLRVPQY